MKKVALLATVVLGSLVVLVVILFVTGVLTFSSDIVVISSTDNVEVVPIDDKDYELIFIIYPSGSGSKTYRFLIGKDKRLNVSSGVGREYFGTDDRVRDPNCYQSIEFSETVVLSDEDYNSAVDLANNVTTVNRRRQIVYDATFVTMYYKGEIYDVGYRGWSKSFETSYHEEDYCCGWYSQELHELFQLLKECSPISVEIGE
jgi:hypothetical protein